MNSSLKHHWVTILVATLVTFTASVALTMIQPMEYRSAFTVLTIDQNPTLDGYAAAKSAERLSQSLSTTIATTAFADQVYQQLKDQVSLIGNPIVSADVQTRRDAWKKEIVAQADPNVGQVLVRVYQKDPAQATTIANAVMISITAYGTSYLGGGQDVALKVVDSPLVTKSPVRPNVFANLGVGLVLGFGGSIAYFLLFTGTVAATMPMMYAPMMLPMSPQPQPQPLEPPPTPEPVRIRHRRRYDSDDLEQPPVQVVEKSEPVATPSPRHVEPIRPASSTQPHIPPTHPPHPTSVKSASPANLPVMDDEWVMP